MTKSEPDTVGTALAVDIPHNGHEVQFLDDAAFSGRAGERCVCTAPLPTPPLWPCLSCGALNRLRDTTCRHCGDPKPEAYS